MTTRISICLLAWFATTATAHDPYEITSTAYVRSNQIELFIELEFPTGMKLAGINPLRDAAVVSQFESALPRLRELAGSFFRLTAGNNAVAVLSTNVELGVEDHIRFRLEYAATPHRPLQFTAHGLGADSDENPYGTSLTVMDMVNQKVLGQTTLFARQPNAQFPPQSPEMISSAAAVEIPTPSTNTLNQSSTPQSTTTPAPFTPIPARCPIRLDLLLIYGLIGAVVFTVVVYLRKHRR